MNKTFPISVKNLNAIHNVLSIYSAMIADYNSEDPKIYNRAARAISEDGGELARKTLQKLGLEAKKMKNVEGYQVEG